MKNQKYSAYSFMLKIQNHFKNKDVSKANKTFIVDNQNQQMYVKNPTGKKLFVAKDGTPTLDVKDADSYKWIPFMKGSGKNRKINPFFSIINYIRSYAFESDVVTCFQYTFIDKLDKDGNVVLDSSENPIQVKTLTDLDKDGKAITYEDCDVVLTYEVKQTFQSKALYEFNPSSEDINSLSDDTVNADDDDDDNYESLEF